MRTIFRATDKFLEEVRADLARPHAFAAERVGFISVRAAAIPDGTLLLAEKYHPVADEDYIDDKNVGAMMSQEAIRKALNIALLRSVGMFHVHMHAHMGRPWFSRTDLREQVKFIPDFFKVCRKLPHGAVVLSRDCAAGRIWLGREKVATISEFNAMGAHVRIDTPKHDGSVDVFV